MNKKWNNLISEFRKNGGVAENVCQKDGVNGRGIFPINFQKKSKIYTPDTLMINKDDIYLDDNKLRIKEDKKYSKNIKDFFSYYQDNFSWGEGGREATELFEKGLKLFNPDLKSLLKHYSIIDIEKRHEGNWNNVILKQFLDARAFKFKKSSMICPVLELVNHEVISLPFIIHQEGISTPNYPPLKTEITHNYSPKSSLSRFFTYGFFCKETIVFSIPFNINIKGRGINIFCKGNDINDDSMKIERSGNKIAIEGLPISDINNHKLPVNYFNELIKRIDDANIKNDLFLKIIELNITTRKNILKKLNSTDDNIILHEFRKLLDYDISSLSSYN